MARNGHGSHIARDAACNRNRQKMLGASLRCTFEQNVAQLSRLTREPALKCCVTGLAQPLRALLDDAAFDLRHLRRPRAGALRVRKHMQEAEDTLLDQGV